MSIILGIDPGSRVTGYGIIQKLGNRLQYVSSGSLRITGRAIGPNLQQIFEGIRELVQRHQPDEAAIEEVFMHQNAGAALKLGQARGAAIVAVASDNTPVAEYSARQIKQAVVGYGAAQKQQVQHMVCQLLNLSKAPQNDAADGLAIAICHAHSRGGMGRLTNLRIRRGRIQ